ncbi:MAG: hypothetical protein WD226_03870 [Planctomycetota bacterium]
MIDERTALLQHVLRDVAQRLDAGDEAAWTLADQALVLTKEEGPEIAAAIEARDADAVRALVAGWESGKLLAPVHDRTILKRALKSFRKSLKVTRLDAESSLGGGPMSSGRQSSIVGITPPRHYPRAVWDELVRLGRLLDSGQGTYELPPE